MSGVCIPLHRVFHVYFQDLQLYLLQLVQALKYEDFEEVCAGLDPRSLMLSVRSFNSADSFPSPDRNNKSTASGDLAALTGGDELESPTMESAPLLPSPDGGNPPPVPRFVHSEVDTSSAGSEDYSVDLATFLIQRACANSALANYFYW